MAESTPMMSQYLGIKEQYRDAVLFFRLGDFYEMFNEDAVEVSRLLNLTLTHRAGSPMCGVPYHASRVYIARLLRAGKKIAICEQITIPGPGKGIAERKVVEVITPGTVVEEDYLDRSANNYLAALTASSTRAGPVISFAYIDVSTGEFAVTSFPEDEASARVRKELGRIRPSEILLQLSLVQGNAAIAEALDEYPSLVQNKFPDWAVNSEIARKRLCSLFGTETLAAFSLNDDSPELSAAGLLVDYLSRTAGTTLVHVRGIAVYGEGECVQIDDSTRKNLELERNLRDSTPAYSLLETLDHTRTSMGARLLRKWVVSPLVDVRRITERVDAVTFLYRKQRLLSGVRTALSGILDIERLSARVAMERAHAKDLVAIRQSLSGVIELSRLLMKENAPADLMSSKSADVVVELQKTLQSALLDDCPIVLNEGGMIRPGWSGKLDELTSLRDNSNSVLNAYLDEERELTGISNLRIKYNRMLGYYLEVSKGNLSSVPSHFIRRRSLANGDRYTTDRLVELETELNGVEAKIVECERDLFLEMRSQVASQLPLLSEIAQGIAKLDAVQSYAYAATAHGWVRPVFCDDGSMEISEGRHPVVEAHLPQGSFIPNGIRLSSNSDSSDPSFALITGPNMAGKSTFLRQTALIVLMAQSGSYVPASEAVITPVDRVFCRVGASDNLARGESTFLVEMTETAHILRSATRNSLVIMDEVGRGTSTEDGLSLATAILEHLLQRTGAKTLFATHYHELSKIQSPRLQNFCLDVLESEGEVVFLKRLKRGASANSYGIHVARLAGVPKSVLDRARELLESYSHSSFGHQSSGGNGNDSTGAANQSCADSADSADSADYLPTPRAVLPSPQLFTEEELVLDEILSIDTDRLTPIDALSAIDRWKKKLFPEG